MIPNFERTPVGWTFADSDVALAELLDEFEFKARAAGAPVDQLAPGADPDEVRSVLESSGLACHPQLLEWFGWHNGYKSARPDAASSLPQMIASSVQSSAEWGCLPDPYQSWMLLSEEAWGPVVDLTADADQPITAAFASDDFNPDALARRGGLVYSLTTVVAWWIFGVDSGGYSWNGAAWEANPELLHPSQQAVHFF
jgi:hypothetical protein